MPAQFLPVLNLLNQLLKQISKPVSFRIVRYAKSHPVFSRYFLIFPGRWFHALDQRVRRRVILGRKGDEKSKHPVLRVDDETAIETGANLMSECIIFLIAGLGVMAEVIRSARNSAAKEAVKAEQMKTLVDKKDAISLKVAKQAAMISELEEIVNECIRLETTAHPSPVNGEK